MTRRYYLGLYVARFESARVRDLAYTERDAFQLGRQWLELGFDWLPPLPAWHGERHQLERALRAAAARLEPGDELVVYVATHGVSVGHEDLSLLCADADPSSDSGRVSVGELLQWTRVEGVHRLFLLDCCRENPMAGTRGVAAPALARPRNIDALIPAAEPELGSYGLLYACDPEVSAPVAMESDALAGSLFTVALCRVLRALGARAEEDPDPIPLDQGQLFRALRKSMQGVQEEYREEFAGTWQDPGTAGDARLTLVPRLLAAHEEERPGQGPALRAAPPGRPGRRAALLLAVLLFGVVLGGLWGPAAELQRRRSRRAAAEAARAALEAEFLDLWGRWEQGGVLPPARLAECAELLGASPDVPRDGELARALESWPGSMDTYASFERWRVGALNELTNDGLRKSLVQLEPLRHAARAQWASLQGRIRAAIDATVATDSDPLDLDAAQRVWADLLSSLLGVPLSEEAPGQLEHPPGHVWVVVPPGRRWIGTIQEDAARRRDEPLREHVLDRPLLLGRELVTVAQYERFQAARPTPVQSDRLDEVWFADPVRHLSVELAGQSWKSPGYVVQGEDPVSCLSAADAQAYAAWLSEATRPRHFVLGLPYEADWEYAVGVPEWGVEDALGSLLQWTHSIYLDHSQGWIGETGRSVRALRGSPWVERGFPERIAARHGMSMDAVHGQVGFRLFGRISADAIPANAGYGYDAPALDPAWSRTPFHEDFEADRSGWAPRRFALTLPNGQDPKFAVRAREDGQGQAFYMRIFQSYARQMSAPGVCPLENPMLDLWVLVEGGEELPPIAEHGVVSLGAMDLFLRSIHGRAQVQLTVRTDALDDGNLQLVLPYDHWVRVRASVETESRRVELVVGEQSETATMSSYDPSSSRNHRFLRVSSNSQAGSHGLWIDDLRVGSQ